MRRNQLYIEVSQNSFQNTSLVFSKHTVKRPSNFRKNISIDYKKTKLPKKLSSGKLKGKLIFKKGNQKTKAGKKKLRKFFQGITKFENNLRQHRRHLTDLLLKQDSSKDEILAKYRTKGRSLNHSQSKKVGLSVSNFSLIKKELNYIQNKPPKIRNLKSRVSIKEAKNPFKDYIGKMYEHRRKEPLKPSKEFYGNNKLDYIRKHSLKEKIVNYKNDVLGRKKSKDIVTILLFQNLLISFIKKEDIKRVKKILKSEPGLAEKMNEENKLPLHYAIMNGNIELFFTVFEKSKEALGKEKLFCDCLQLAYDLNRIEIVKVGL